MPVTKSCSQKKTTDIMWDIINAFHVDSCSKANKLQSQFIPFYLQIVYRSVILRLANDNFELTFF